MQIPENLKPTPWQAVSLVLVVLLGILVPFRAPPGTLPPLLLALALWTALGFRLQTFLPLTAFFFVLTLQGHGPIAAPTTQPAILWAVVFGLAGVLARLFRGNAWAALLSGALWGGMALFLPGLAPLAAFGLPTLAFLHADHRGKLVVPGLLVLTAALVWHGVSGGVPPDLLRPADPETYRLLGLAFQELFQRESLWIAIVVPGLFEPAQTTGLDLKPATRHFPILGSLLCLLFLTSETAFTLAFFVGLPLASITVTRWILALPGPLRRVSSRLSPPSHVLPDNIWHTLLTAGLAFAFAWLAWADGLDRFRSEAPLTPVEAALFEGETAHPLYAWIESLTDPSVVPPGFWNRLLSLFGLLFTLVAMTRLLTRQVGLQLALVSVVVFLSFPGLAVWLATAGSGSMAIGLFLTGLVGVTLEEDEGSWTRGGVWIGLGVAFAPLWLAPALGLVAGVFEAYRSRVLRVSLGILAGVAGGLVVFLVLNAGGMGGLFAIHNNAPEDFGLWVLPLRFPVVTALGLLLLGMGATRRGPGWWALVLSLPAALFLSDAAGVLVPLIALGCLGLARLPSLMDLRHPAVYQTVLTTQLLLWIPVMTAVQDRVFFP